MFFERRKFEMPEVVLFKSKEDTLPVQTQDLAAIKCKDAKNCVSEDKMTIVLKEIKKLKKIVKKSNEYRSYRNMSILQWSLIIALIIMLYIK